MQILQKWHRRESEWKQKNYDYVLNVPWWVFLKALFYTAARLEEGRAWEQWSTRCRHISRGRNLRQKEACWCFISSSLKILKGFNRPPMCNTPVIRNVLLENPKTCFSFPLHAIQGIASLSRCRLYTFGFVLLGILERKKQHLLHPSSYRLHFHAQINFTHS